jgi:protein gp37
MVGCSLESPGCTNCYAMSQTAWLANKLRVKKYLGLTVTVKQKPVWTGEVRLYTEDLAKPLHVRKPTMWFVNSMSDMFHPGFTDAEIDRVFEVMALCPHHTFQILTKRAERMARYCAKREVLPNVWLGVSAERQREAEERIPWLLATKAAIRFVSAEPLLGPIDFCEPEYFEQPRPLDWVIVGGESGRYARECQSEWIRLIVNQCETYRVPVFVKQLGSKSDLPLKDKKGGDMFEFPEHLRIRQWPVAPTAPDLLTLL